MKRTRFTLRAATFSVSAMLLAIFSAATGAQPEKGQFDETSALMGKQIFRSYCASCHGSEARGDGSVAKYLTIEPADLTRINKRNDGEFPFDRIFQTIDGREAVRGHGKREMPIWGDAFKKTRDNPDEEAVKEKITHLVHFLRSIQEE